MAILLLPIAGCEEQIPEIIKVTGTVGTNRKKYYDIHAEYYIPGDKPGIYYARLYFLRDGVYQPLKDSFMDEDGRLCYNRKIFKDSEPYRFTERWFAEITDITSQPGEQELEFYVTINSKDGTELARSGTYKIRFDSGIPTSTAPSNTSNTSIAAAIEQLYQSERTPEKPQKPVTADRPAPRQEQKSTPASTAPSSNTVNYYATIGYGSDGAVWLGSDDSHVTIHYNGSSITIHNSSDKTMNGLELEYAGKNDKGNTEYKGSITQKSGAAPFVFTMTYGYTVVVFPGRRQISIASTMNGNMSSVVKYVSSRAEQAAFVKKNGHLRRSAATSSGSNYDSGSDYGSGSSSSSSSGSSRYGYRTCPQCHGSKKCRTCGGDGVTSSYYTGGSMVCPNCTNGKCSYCNGTGQVYGVK